LYVGLYLARIVHLHLHLQRLVSLQRHLPLLAQEEALVGRCLADLPAVLPVVCKTCCSNFPNLIPPCPEVVVE
jgi:hypothetical protein